ncbi:uncharacterized protein KZ484_024899 isoform 2-T2 [Pholidichthys leucotaenia]
MYPQQGPRPFPNRPIPPRQPPPNQRQGMGFRFPRPTQLPDELESALAIRGGRDIDHNQIDIMNRPNLPQHGVDWPGYQSPPNPFSGAPPPTVKLVPQRTQEGMRNWPPPASALAPQARSRVGEGPGFYTPESAGSILASFGLSNEDLEMLSHYPDDQLTPDTLPFILRDIQINKSGKQKASSSFSQSVHDMPLSASGPLPLAPSSEVPSFMTVTQTTGKVIDYGHASRAEDKGPSRETFKREPLSSERTVKMYSALSATSSPPKVELTERRQVHLEHTKPSKHRDADYRRAADSTHRSSRSPRRKFSPPPPQSRNIDGDQRHDKSKQRPSSETRSKTSSRRSLSSSPGSKPDSSSKKLPTDSMISDFLAVTPTVYPHTCSLCLILCSHKKAWIEHVNTVNHTSVCRDLRNKYPDWKPDLSSRSKQYDSQDVWDPKNGSPSQSPSHSRSQSPSQGKYYHPSWQPYSPHRPQQHPRYNKDYRSDRQRSYSPSYMHRPSSYSREHHPSRRGREPPVSSSRGGVKRHYDEVTRHYERSRDHPLSAAAHSSKHGPSQSSSRSSESGAKPGTKTAKLAAKPPPLKKKKTVTPASQDLSIAERLVFLTGIPEDASEQEVTDLVCSFGKINNVILMPCSEEESEKSLGQKASVCMLKAEEAQALAASPNLSIRDQPITALMAKKPEAELSTDAKNSRPAPGQDKEADQKTFEVRLLITGLPESGWSESDIISLIQPYGIPSDIIMATQIGKTLVSVPDMETAQEIVKVNNFTPAKINDCEVKMTLVKQPIGLSTPVALYNILMGSADLLENSGPVAWNSLLVISNVPDGPFNSSEVQKLVRRFGTVIKTLVLNNTVICEMATSAIALSVYKRFQTFPCIIQSNPLFFSRKADPKISSQPKTINSPEDALAKDSESKTAAADKEEVAPQDILECSFEEMENESDNEDRNTEITKDDVEVLEQTESNDKLPVSDSSALDTKPEADMNTNTVEACAPETVTKAAEEEKGSRAPGVGDKSVSGEDKKSSSLDTTAASQEPGMPPLPKMTQAMVNALLVECRTRTANRRSSSTCEEQSKTQTETEQGQETEEKTKKAEETKEAAKTRSKDGEDKVKKNERREARKEEPQRERENREKDRMREKDRRDEERRDWGRRYDDRRDWGRRYDDRREWERRDRERGRKRPYEESTWRSSSRSEGSRQGNRREECRKSVEKEEFDEFPFNMSDFLTVDEVGDVADLPMEAPHGDDAGDVEVTPSTDNGDEGKPAPEHVSAPTVEPSDAQVLPELVPGSAASPPLADSAPEHKRLKSCEPEAPEIDIAAEPETLLRTTEGSTSEDAPVSTSNPSTKDESSDGSGAAVVTAESEEDTSLNPSQAVEENKKVPNTEEEQGTVRDEENTKRGKAAAGTETTLMTTEGSIPEDGPVSTPDPSAKDDSSDGSGAAVVTAESEKKDSSLNPTQAVEENKKMPNTEEEQGMVRDEKNTERGKATADTGNQEQSEDQSSITEERVEPTLKKKEHSLPPFDPNNPVGLEFLVPKTGFFCKVCNRFFTGAKEAMTAHSKTRNHYDNTQKFFSSKKT